MSNPRDDLLTEYLARLRANLEGLPKSEREEAYRELTQHVESLVNEASLVGSDSDKVIQDALQKFGDPEKIGRRVVTDYWRRRIHSYQLNFYRAPFQPRLLLRVAQESSMGAVIAGTILTSWLQILVMMIAMIFDISPSIGALLGAISGIPLGLAGGWNWAKGRAQNFARGPKSPWQRWAREHMAFILAAIVTLLALAIFFEMESHLALFPKRSLVMNTAMLLADMIIACVSQRFFLPRLKKAQSE